MDRQKLYDKEGKFTGKYLKIAGAIHLSNQGNYHSDRKVTYQTLIETANSNGYFTKNQLKNMKKGQVIVCPNSQKS